MFKVYYMPRGDWGLKSCKKCFSHALVLYSVQCWWDFVWIAIKLIPVKYYNVFFRMFNKYIIHPESVLNKAILLSFVCRPACGQMKVSTSSYRFPLFVIVYPLLIYLKIGTF